MKNNRKEIINALNSITQLGLSVSISFLLWIFIAKWFQKTFSLGNYIMVFGVIAGTGSAALSFLKFLKLVAGKEHKDE